MTVLICVWRRHLDVDLSHNSASIFPMSTITFVTGNKNKLKEVQQLLGEKVTNHALDLLEVQGTYEEIITHKAHGAAEAIKGPVMVEDTALEFEAWGELPGPYIKWFLANLGPDGISKMLEGFENKSANAVCTVGFCEGPGAEVKIFQGKTHGKIVPPRGPQTFGWDCTFQPDDYDLTYAEMTKDLKNSISHRGKAMGKFADYLMKLNTGS